MGTQPTNTYIIGALAAAIAAQFSFIVWLFRDVLGRANERIRVLEEREVKTLDVMTANVGAILDTLKAMADIAREQRLVGEMRGGISRPSDKEKGP